MALQCDGDTSTVYRLGTDWWSSEDQGLVITLGINCVVTCVVLAVYACLSRRVWWKRIYSPNADIDMSKHPLIRETDPCVSKLIGKESKTHVHETLEHTMMQRYFRMITSMFLWFALFAVPILIPLYAANVYLGTDIDPAPPPPPPFPPAAPPLPPLAPGEPSAPAAPSLPELVGLAPFSGLATFSLSHLPPGSPRFWASFIGMIVMTAIFLVLARREMEMFITLRLKWLCQPRPELYAARLITYMHRPAPLGAGGGAMVRPTGEEMAAVLAPILGPGLSQVLPVPRHPFWPSKVSQGLGKLESGAKAGVHTVERIESRVERKATGLVRKGEAEDRVSSMGLLAELKMVTLGEDTESAYILLFKTRQARFAAVNSPSLLTNATVGSTILSAKAVPAAAPHDCNWAALSTPKWIIVLAWVGVVLFFGFWNVPVAIVQSFASLQAISRLMADIGLGAISDWLLGLSPQLTSLIEGFLPSLLLAGLVILAYEIMPILSLLQGRDSGTSNGLSTQRKFWLFNYLIIILASSLVGSLIETADQVLDGGTCVIFSLLGRSIPEQGSFWLNYLLQDALFLIPVMDILQLSPAACFLLCGGLCGCCCNKICGPTGWFTNNIVRACQKLRYYKFYGRSSIVISASLLFCCISPLIILITIPWSIVIARVWDHNHKRTLFHPLELGFDSGGMYWLLAMKQLSYSVMLAQLSLAAVHGMSQSYGTAVLLLVLMFMTMFRFGRLHYYYSSKSLELPLEECARLDTEFPAGDDFLHTTAARYEAKFCGAAKKKTGAEAGPEEAGQGGPGEGQPAAEVTHMA